MRGIAVERRKLIGVGVGVGVGVGAGLAVLPAWWALHQVANVAKGDWHTDTAPLEQAFPLLGPLTDAKWVSSRDNDRDLPSPELVISGLARLKPGKLAELTAAHAFVSEGPADDFSSWFEKPLKGEGPQNPQWIRSQELDRDGSGHSTHLWFDRRSGTVRFRALNPYG
ncbi:hypothetical protein [Streptomyces sp. NBC_01443]|uniref:hypothetical protein n=1 Tax=Streptomyces sp. NBC_01443 TaxID=2903868 RepID=UPI002255D031|nr:hypothetical protein [Streptomyces sp. NBC_01443]MCX4625436.1 hypothetical protein [Streptomyces sp. NBC_01443]